METEEKGEYLCIVMFSFCFLVRAVTFYAQYHLVVFFGNHAKKWFFTISGRDKNTQAGVGAGGG